jgi:hypothetical protein
MYTQKDKDYIVSMYQGLIARNGLHGAFKTVHKKTGISYQCLQKFVAEKKKAPARSTVILSPKSSLGDKTTLRDIFKAKKGMKDLESLATAASSDKGKIIKKIQELLLQLT